MYCLNIRGQLPYSACAKINWCTNLISAIEHAAKSKVQVAIRRQLVNMLSHHMIQLEADDRRSAQEMLKLYDGFFDFLQKMETAVQSRNPQVPFEFDAKLTEEIKGLQSGLKSHCTRQNAVRDTRLKRDDPRDPDSWSAYKKRQALEQRNNDHDAALNQPEAPAGEEAQPPGLFHNENGQPVDLFHDKNGQPLNLFDNQNQRAPSDSQTQSQLAKDAPKVKHSRQASNSFEANTKANSKKRRL